MEIRRTDDGSNTIWSEQYRETYHSSYGAITESKHIFIESGYGQTSGPVKVFEVGFGSGLNAFLTFMAAESGKRNTIFHSIELHPIPVEISFQLEYPLILNYRYQEQFESMHQSAWNCEIELSPYFTLQKIHDNLETWLPNDHYDLIYFDAFSPNSQPQLWKEDIFRKMFQMLNPGGMLTTYCAKGIVRRTLEKIGFSVERLPGPPGKREIIRAIRKI